MDTHIPGPIALIILDGWGIGPKNNFNAITTAQPTTFNRLWKTYPHTILKASGDAVGLPDGVFGNSEVGHLTLGAGKIIKQQLVVINDLIKENALCVQPTIQKNFATLANNNGALHLIGLVSDGGVHSHQSHLQALIACAAQAGISKIFIHAILDGRDTLPRSAATYLEELEQFCITQHAGVIASLCGRFYAMDRDEQWDRTRAAFDLYSSAPNITEHHWRPVLEKAYQQGISDEFMPPTNLHAEGFIRPEDGILLYNFRPDRMRQLTSFLLAKPLPLKKTTSIPNYPPKPQYLFCASMVQYHKEFSNPVIVPTADVRDTLLDRLESKGLSIFTIAETEKYAHVTYFFSGGKETTRKHETRILVPSLGIKNYAEQPCMSAPTITKKIVYSLETNPCNFYLINYANADMVGHTGNFEAAVAAVRCVDQQLAILFDEIVEKRNGTIFIVGDHGNAEEMVDKKTLMPKTSHTTNPVPFIAVNTNINLTPMSGLSDVAGILERALYEK